MQYDDMCVAVFLEKQGQLFDEPVAETPQEAREFLDDCMAIVLKSPKEVKRYFKENLDAFGMTDQEILEADEVFALPDGRFLIVEG